MEIMIRTIIAVGLALFAGSAAVAGECALLKSSDLTLLPGTTFDLHYAPPLNGCFTGFLEPHAKGGGSYQFGVFQDGKLRTSLPRMEPESDLSSAPTRHLEILAVAFNDMDKDGRRDVLLIGQRLVASGNLVFVQIYWGCGDRFDYDEDASHAVEWALTGKIINVQAVGRLIGSKKLRSTCGN